MKHPGLKLTEWVLMHPQLSQEAKLVLAATLATPERDARQRQLAEWLPLGRDAIASAQDELEAGFADYRRPTARMAADDPRFREAKSIVALHPKAELNRRPDSKRPQLVFLPGSFCARLPRGHIGKLSALLALVYVAEQAQAGRIALNDHTVAALLRDGTTARAVAHARKALIRAGVLEPIGKQARPKVYRLDLETGPEPTFDADRVPRLRHWQRAGVDVVATKRQWGYLLGRAVALSDAAIDRVLELAAEWDGGLGEGHAHRATTVFDATREVFSAAEPVADSYLPRGQVPTSPGASSELVTQTSTNTRLHTAPSHERGPRETSSFEETIEESVREPGLHMPTKQYLPNVPGGFVWATAETWAKIAQALDAIEARRDLDYRIEAERICLQPKMNGGKMLRQLRRRFAHLVPREPLKLTAEEEVNRAKVHALLANNLFGGSGDLETDEYAA